MSNDDFVLIQGWMINELGLSGNKLLVYAIIYSFTHKTKEHSFKGGSRYLIETAKISRRAIFDILKYLCDCGYIEKEEGEFEGIPYVWYRTTALPVQNLHWGECKNCTQERNIWNTKEEISTSPSEDKSSSFDIDIPKKNPEKVNFQLIISRYNEICKSLPKCLKLTDARRVLIKARWSEYGDGIFTAFEKAEASDFLSGRKGGWNGAHLDWILNASNMVKILEGNYDNDRFKPEVKTTIYRNIKASKDSDINTPWKSESIDF